MNIDQFDDPEDLKKNNDSKSNELPSPETIHKEFENFVKNKFGDKVKIFAQTFNDQNEIPRQSQEAKKDKKKDAIKENILNFNKTPLQIKHELDRFVIKQDEAKKALAIAVCDHYHAVRESYQNAQLGHSSASDSYAKQNVLVLGPTGVGKTYMIRQIAKMIGVPFVKADATRFSETGYVGANADDLIHDLVGQANGDIELAQYGIIYLDEADKLASSGRNGGRDVSGRGVQFSLLKLMEETEVDLRAGNDMKSQMQAFMEFQKRGKIEKSLISTKHILFVISGAFQGLEDIVKNRLSERDIGFHKAAGSHDSERPWLDLATTPDFVEFGFEPEFIGRLPIRVSCNELHVDDLFSILKNSEGSILAQYKKAFAAYGIELSTEDDALRLIASQAAKEKTGARALWTVLEKLLRDFKFNLPSSSVKNLSLSRKLVENPAEVLKELLANEPSERKLETEKILGRFAADFYKDHGMTLTFTPDAVDFFEQTLMASPQAGSQICQNFFSGYEHGLKLIEQNTGKKAFVIDGEALSNPRVTLESWIRDSYRA